MDCEIHFTITVWDGACGGVHIHPVRFFVDLFDVLGHGQDEDEGTKRLYLSTLTQLASLVV